MKLPKTWGLLLCLLCGVAFAADPPPLQLMKQVSGRMLAALQQDKGQLHNRRIIHRIVNRIVVPHFDLAGVARSVVGRNYWYQATPQTRNRFVKAFTNYVIDMYAATLSSYSDEKITFRPMRNFNPSQTRVRIYSVVQRPGASTINVDYRLVQKGKAWKIYDFSVGNVSMVQSYRSQFANTLRRGGLTELTNRLLARNI